MSKNNDFLYFGKQCEHRVFSELLKHNYDLYLPVVDNQGIDVVIKKRYEAVYKEIQVKGRKPTWIFTIHKFVPRNNYFFALLPKDGNLYIVPSNQIRKWFNKKNGISFNNTLKLLLQNYKCVENIKDGGKTLEELLNISDLSDSCDNI